MSRPVKHRDGARVVVLAGGEVLLIADSDPGIPGSGWWVTPGGGLEPGETRRSAAVRELYEETGLQVSAADLEGPVARRVVTHGYSDRIRIQDEVFFRVRVARFEPSSDGLTDAERARVRGTCWWPVDALPDNVWPAELGLLATLTGGVEQDLGDVEESSVPVGGPA